MKKISKVVRVTGNGSWESKYGTMYSFEYEMEDGTILKANHKTEDGWLPVGTEVEYEVTKDDPQYGKSGKVGKPQEQGSGGSGGSKFNGGSNDKVQTYIIRQSSLKAAIDLCSDETQIPSREEVTELAGYFENWVLR